MTDIFSTLQKYAIRLTDIRLIGQAVFVTIVLIISYSGVKVIHTNYQLQQQIARYQQENEIQKLKNENQKLKNNYYRSAQYLELAARQNYGLAAPGEKELIVPKKVALAHLPADITQETTRSDKIQNNQSFFQRNTGAWLDFFLHRASVTD